MLTSVNETRFEEADATFGGQRVKIKNHESINPLGCSLPKRMTMPPLVRGANRLVPEMQERYGNW